MYAIPPVIPAPKLAPMLPKITATPPVMYSHPFDPQPSTTTFAPEFLTAKRSPARPEANRKPSVAPYNTVLPTIVFSAATNGLTIGGRTTIIPPDKPFPT